MAALSPVLRSLSGNEVAFWCPGCEEPHAVRHGGANWTWDGNVDAPTFSPSILVRSGHYIGMPEAGCWCDYNREHPEAPTKFKCGICHSFVRKGWIVFLGDCTHALAGKTVQLPPWPSQEGAP